MQQLLNGQSEPDRKKTKPKSTESPGAKALRKRTEKAKKAETFFIPPPPINNEEENFRHAHWQDKRRRVRAALVAAETSRSAVENFDNCGSDAAVFYDKENKKWKITANLCHCRHCEPCMRSKGNLLAKNLAKKVTDSAGKQFRFITLTLKHCDDPLETQINKLYDCFKKLRNSKVWKESQNGGAGMFECKFNGDRGEWHPHLHIVAEGFFLHHRDLSAEWYAITGDSFRVDIRVIKSAKDAAFYVAKYVSKGTNDDVWNNHHAAEEWVRAMKGRRTCMTYGTWRGMKLLEKEPQTGDYKYVDQLAHIVRAAERGEQWAIRMYDSLKADLQYNPHKKRTKRTGTLPIDPT